MLAVHVDIANNVMRLALTYVLENGGHRRASSEADADAVVVDCTTLRRAAIPSRPATIVVDPSPACCQLAVDAVMSGRVRAAICSDDPETLLGALEASRDDNVLVAARIIDQARHAPRLSGRLARTLQLVLAGHSNAGIGHQLHQSESTVKRDITALQRRFAVRSRAELLDAARSAGFGTPFARQV